MKNHSIFRFSSALLLMLAVVLVSCQPKAADKSEAATPQTNTTSTTKKSRLPIAYINSDTLLANYTYFVTAMKALSDKQQKASATLEKKGRALQNSFVAVQKKVQNGELTANQIAKEEQRLNNRQQALAAEEQKMAAEISQENQEVQDTLYSNLRRVLQKYADEHGYEYILTYAGMGMGSQVLVAPKESDITPEILKILNAEGGE